MSQKSKKYILLAITIILFVVIGFLRDFIFVNINYQIGYLDQKTYLGNQAINYTHSSLSFLYNWSASSLIYLKWILTLVFTIIYWAISYLAIHSLYPTKKVFKIITGLYLSIILISSLLYLSGYFLISHVAAFRLSRVFMGFAQSPILAMILIPAFKLLEQNKSQK